MISLRRTAGCLVALLLSLPLTLVVAPQGAVVPSADAARTPPPVLRTGSVLFVGGHRIAKTRNVRRLYVPGTKVKLEGLSTGRIRVPGVGRYRGTNDAADGDIDADGGGVLFKDATVLAERVNGRRLFRMWFGSGYNVGYRESTDGVNWRVRDPDSVIVAMNVVNPAVMKDRVTGRYVMTGWDRHKRRYVELVSRDGFKWTASSGFSGPLSRLAGDVIYANADTATRRLHAVAKDRAEQGRLCRSNPPTYAGGRVFSQHTSYGANRTWTRTRVRISSDCVDARSATPLNNDPNQEFHPYASTMPVHVYGMPFQRYGDQMLGFPWLYRIARLGDTPDDTRAGYSDGPIDTQIASARAFGGRWQRADPRRVRPGGRLLRPPLIKRGPPGSWDNGMIFGHAPVLIRGNEVAMYYTGYNTGHKPVPGVTRARLGKATWERDRFVGLEVINTKRVGRVLTRPFRLPATASNRTLYVNVKLPARGVIRAQVIDARTGKPFRGYTLSRSATRKGNHFAARINWNGKNIGRLGTRPLRIDFRFTRGTFFSYRVG